LGTRNRATKKVTRTYTLGRRAEQQAETRQRIAEAALELHSTIGPARTTLSMVAERAGVQRHTLYAHFPDERSLFRACTGLSAERDPLPDAEPWRAIADPGERLRVGLRTLYDWYERNAALVGNVLRDVELHPLAREANEQWAVPAMATYAEVLGARLTAQQQALLPLALSYYTWRTLTGQSGLKQDAAVAAMLCVIDCAR
jgi:AcrR family transcriptional regulator